ncbi:MAG: AraC family transcriptional regulator [Firmicutes bacterium]|nr:AraC family transcriptional regulator [Bacillota bacterium]
MLKETIGYLDDMPMNIRIVNIKNYPLHYHYDHEFIYVLKGSAVLKCGSSIYQMQQGDVFIVNDSEVHGITDCSNDNVVLLIQINADYFIRQFPTLEHYVFRTMEKDRVNEEIIVLRNLLLKTGLNYLTKRPGYKTTNTNIMIDVLNYCDRNFKSFYFEGRIVMHKRYDYPEMGKRLGRIIDYIYEHHSEKLSLRELAKKEHFSEGYLSRLITAGTGLGFRELLAFARVEESEKMLLSGSQKISSIAAEVGFSTTAYYEKFFRKWFGCYPEEYRKLYANKIKGSSPELIFEISQSEATSIISKSIQTLSFEGDENTENKLTHHDLKEDELKEQHRKEILDAYERTTRSHDEILRFMLSAESEDAQKS